jgi:hypothetical protein
VTARRAGVLVVLACLALAACTHGSTAKAPPTNPTSPQASPSEVVASPCAVSVADFLVSNGVRADDTAAFTAAMGAAEQKHPRCYRTGPSGKPQAVVYVPAEVYRLSGLTFHNNLRLEVDAGATLQPPPNRPGTPSQTWMPLIVWDAGTGHDPLSNVSIVGVGATMTDHKTATVVRLGSALSGFSVADYFTLNLDPAQTGSTNYATGINLVNVKHFLIQNVFSIQNQTPAPIAKITPWPTSSRAVLELYSRPDSPVGGPYYDPRAGRIVNQVNVGSPRGYGPNQVNSAQDVDFSNVLSDGGTTLRLETDGSQTATGEPTRGSYVDGLRASHIVGVNCNRAVALVPHAQRNGSVVVDDVRAYSCAEAVASLLDHDIEPARRGTFGTARVTEVLAVAGAEAQLPGQGDALWTVGASQTPVQADQQLGWAATVSGISAQGRFVR